MKFSVLAETFEKMEKTTKRLELTDHLVDLFKNTPPDLVSKITYLIQGKLRPDFEGIEALILGCTHYPLIKEQVSRYFDQKVEVLDSAEIVAAGLKAMLEYYHLVNQSNSEDDHFLVSDYTPFFEEAAQRFFHESVKLEKYPLWE